VKQNTVTKVYYEVKNDAGEPVRKFTSEEAFNKQLAKAQKDGEQAPSLLRQLTYTVQLAETPDEALALSGNDQEIFVTHFNYGSSLRQHNEASDLLSDDNFQPTEGAMDMGYSVAEKSEGRRKMTNEEKAAKALGVTPEQLMAALASIKQANPAAVVTA
jgi:hypothetical protein